MDDVGRLLLTLSGITGLFVLALGVVWLVGTRSRPGHDKDSVSQYERTLAARWLPRIWKPVVAVMVSLAAVGVILIAFA